MRQLTDQRLPFDLQPDEEEEQRHQAVIDPEMQRLGKPGARETESQVGVPEVKVAAGPR